MNIGDTVIVRNIRGSCEKWAGVQGIIVRKNNGGWSGEIDYFVSFPSYPAPVPFADWELIPKEDPMAEWFSTPH